MSQQRTNPTQQAPSPQRVPVRPQAPVHPQGLTRQIIQACDEMKTRILILIGVFLFAAFIHLHHSQYRELIYVKNSLSNFYKEFDSSVLTDVSEMKRFLAKVVSESEQLMTIDEIHEASRKFNSKIDILQNFELDKTGRPDLAMSNSGGSIAGISFDTVPFYTCNRFHQFIGCINKSNGPEKMIETHMEPGECFKFKGKKGSVIIRLVYKAILDSITVEHVTKQMTPTGEVTNAPRIFSVSGLNKRLKAPFQFGTFKFEANSTTIETFKFKTLDTKAHRYVKINFLDNNGHPDETCVYRIRIHGVVLDKKKKKKLRELEIKV